MVLLENAIKKIFLPLATTIFAVVGFFCCLLQVPQVIKNFYNFGNDPAPKDMGGDKEPE